MIRALFVSDIHITSSEDPKYQLFLRFLEACQRLQPQYLFLVGDIFDLWISDRSFFVDRYQAVALAIKRLTAGGTEVHYFEGNHDLDLSTYWAKQLNVKTHEEAFLMDIGPWRFRIEHGDQMDPDDRGYLFLRWLLRTPVLRFLCRHLPERFVQWLGTRASHASRGYTSHVKVASDAQVKAKMQKHAERVYAAGPFDVLVAGHVHVLEDAERRTGTGTYRCINLGTWLKEPTVLTVSESQIQLQPLAQLI